jgi:hypothetical protein
MGEDDTLCILAVIAFSAVGLFLSSLDPPVLEDAGVEEVLPFAP